MPEQINIKNVPDELYEQARIIAIKQKRSLPKVVKELLEKWVKEQEGKLKT